MKLIYSIIILLLTVNGWAQSGLPPETVKAIDNQFFSDERDYEPGYIVAVVKDGQLAYNRSTGFINVSKELPLNQFSRFALASVTKQFTAFAILLLEQEGKLNRSDDIHNYIPELPSYPFSIQIKHLLSHTSGIRDHLTILEWENNQQSHFYDFEGTINSLREYCWTSFTPGEDFAYSNTGYILLATIVERVSGQSFESFLQERIFDPLEMRQTECTFRRKGEEFGHSTAYAYNSKRERFRMFKIREVNALGATGIYTTVTDLLKWDRNFTTHQIGSDELFRIMETSDTLNNGQSVHYNNGLKHSTIRKNAIIEHSGGWANYNIQYTRIPSLNISFVIAANNEFDYPIEMGERLTNLLIPSLDEHRPSPLDFEDCGLKEGLYLSDNMTLRQVVNVQGKIGIQIPGDTIHGIYYLYRNDKDSCFVDRDGYRFCADSNRFIWSGGGYFNTARAFIYRENSSDIDYTLTSGKYINCEMGTIRLKYRKMRGDYLMIGSLIKRIPLKSVHPCLFEDKKHGFKIVFTDPYTFQLGNNRVFDLEFKRILE